MAYSHTGWESIAAAGRIFRALRSVAAAVRVDAVALMLLDDRRRLRAVGGTTPQGQALDYAHHAELAGPARDSLLTGRPIVLSDLRERTAPGRRAVRAAPVRAVLAIPVRVGGTVVGSLNFYRYRPSPWPAEQVRAGEQLADVIAALLALLAPAHWAVPVAEAG